MALGIAAVLLAGFCIFVAKAPGQLTKTLLAGVWALMAVSTAILILVAVARSAIR